jgi:peptidoglycan hydrolase-like protein with peptidoglycan-binding domain
MRTPFKTLMLTAAAVTFSTPALADNYRTYGDSYYKPNPHGVVRGDARTRNDVRAYNTAPTYYNDNNTDGYVVSLDGDGDADFGMTPREIENREYFEERLHYRDRDYDRTDRRERMGWNDDMRRDQRRMVTANADADMTLSSGQIMSIQRRLNAAGYNVSVDGQLGPQTSAAIRQYQRANNLAVTGNANAATLRAMADANVRSQAGYRDMGYNDRAPRYDNARTADRDLAYRDRRDGTYGQAEARFGNLTAGEVRLIQEELRDEGYRIATDGVMGPNTRDAVRDFQRKNNLRATGNINARTLAALGLSA